MSAETFDQIADEWIAAALRNSPAGATSLGIHDYDSELPARSRSAIEAHGLELRGFLGRLEAIEPDTLAVEDRPDHELLRRRILWELVSIEELQSWRRSPAGYLGTIGGGCNGLIIRDFAPITERAKCLVDRLRRAPELLAEAKANLKDCPHVYVETAIEQAAGLRVLLHRDLPEALSGLEDATLRRHFEDAQQGALAAVNSFAAWMHDDLLPACELGGYAYGEDHFRKLLSYTDFVDRPLAELEKRGLDDLRANQAMLKELAAKIDPSKTPADVVDLVSQDHPTADQLIPETDALLDELRDFAVERGLATMPTDVRIRVAETPSFARMTTQAACSTPGPFEQNATEAYYYVTPPDASWPAERTEAFLKFFNRFSIPGITAHEAYPGHYVHISWLRKGARKLPHFLMTTTTTEGWAHYVEQAFVEAGYGDGDPRYQIMQVREALIRLCRYLVSIGLHTQGWTFQQGVDFFLKEGFATLPIAERETRRGTMGPNYYAYTLGKHEILSLRDKVKAKQGAAYNQLAFHDAFMKLPYPVPIIEQIMLGELG